MHYNTLFQDINLKNFLGRGTDPPQILPLGREKSPDPTPSAPTAPRSSRSALHTSRFRHSVLCVPYFQCRLLATLDVTNVVLQGK